MRSNLKQARKAAGLTQQALAKQLGLSLIGYRQIEIGKRIGKIETWDKLEDLFNIHQRILREDFPEVVCNPDLSMGQAGEGIP